MSTDMKSCLIPSTENWSLFAPTKNVSTLSAVKNDNVLKELINSLESALCLITRMNI